MRKIKGQRSDSFREQVDIKGSMNKENIFKKITESNSLYSDLVVVVHIYYLIQNFFYSDTSVQILTPGELILVKKKQKKPTRQYLLVHRC